jgi:hypothetical protein
MPQRNRRNLSLMTSGLQVAFLVGFNVDTSGNETVLHSFTGAADGANPYAGVVYEIKP